MNDNDKKMLWMYHPNTYVRALRLKLPNRGIDPKINLSPSYGDNISIGILIQSFGEYDKIINVLKSLFKYKILIYDDYSENLEKIKTLSSNNISVYSPEKSLWHNEKISYFDQSAFKYGLDWAKKNKIDVLIKISTDSNISEKNIDDLINLIKKSDGLTFSRSNTDNSFMTDIFAVNVNAWTTEYADNLMNWYNENEIPIISESWYHELAKELDFQNFSLKYEKFKKDNFKGYIKSGYVEWSL